MMFLVSSLLVFMAFANFADAVQRGSIIPLYIYPRTEDGSDAWKSLKDAFKLYPIKAWAIINPSNGPGLTKDPVYAAAINDLKNAGINTLGYVSTNYTRRPACDVRKDINKWGKWYKPNGIFFDEMTNDPNKKFVNYYSNLNSFAKSQGYNFTVGNPGTNVPLQYFKAVDTIMIYEKSSYPSSDNDICSPNSPPQKKSLGMFPYNVATLDEAAILRAKECLGFIYVTNDSLPNPWDTLPPYLSNLFEILFRQ